ncbi:hypothetical protein A5634_16670 [Mycobacterium asiaticum]|uniref:Cytochrome b5 heme-binding domain-containing protein n=1 Tax=Mycobacterium asiaticum TaxID=1790 RepID=A0A1A3P989_MYCAS|nr:cytochrome b5 domain-containing protein [Mycobacterium asiaticum]OBK30245.1 hypothetical protein A5634_16670 [Mycobacterium asiaticum]
MPSTTPIELLLRSIQNDVYGHGGFVSEEYEFFPRQPLPQHLPAQWSLWDEYVSNLPAWYRTGQVCRNLASLPVLDPAELPDEYLVRANMVLGVLALGWKYSWQEMDEGGQHANAASLARIGATGGTVLEPVHAQIMQPWQAIWRRMGRHRSCVESDLFVANFVYGEDAPYAPEHVTGNNSRLLVPFFQSRTEHRFWFSVVEICSRFPGVSAPLNLQRAMLTDDHAGMVAQLVRLARLWQTIVEEVLASADTRVSAIEWGNTTARWTAAMFEGEEGFSGLFSPAWHVMDQLIGRTKYGSFLGQIMLRTRAMLPPSWQKLIAAVGEMPVSDYVATHRARCPELEEAYHYLCQSYDYFFQTHHRKVFAYSYQAILSGREKSNGGIEGTAATPGWELANRHLRVSAAERSTGLRRNRARLSAEHRCHRDSRLLILPVRDMGWLPGDRAAIGIERVDGTRTTILANFVHREPAGDHTYFWLRAAENIKGISSVERQPSPFCRPPSRPASVVIFSDLSCLGMALAIGNHEHANETTIWQESADLPPALHPLVNGRTRVRADLDLAAAILREAREIHRMIDSGVHFYVLGVASFVRRIHGALRLAIGMHSALVGDAVRRLREQRRLNFCVQVDALPNTDKSFYPWNIATATDPKRRVRVVCKGKVLDITSFLTIHLGGDTILSMLAGTDITREFEIAHGAASKTLGMPDVFVEGVAAPIPKHLQPMTDFLYKVVRYTNAFVVTQAEVQQNNEDDIYVQACGLSNAIELWPEATMWGQELADVLRIDTERYNRMSGLCSAAHKNTVAFVKECMADPDSLTTWTDELTSCIRTYEDYGRMLITHLCDILRRTYHDGADSIGQTAPAHIDDVIRFAQIRLGGLGRSRASYVQC